MVSFLLIIDECKAFMPHTEALRRSAESTMHKSVRTVFSRLRYLDPETEERKLARAQEVAASQTDITPSPTPISDVALKSAELLVDSNLSATSPPMQEVPKTECKSFL